MQQATCAHSGANPVASSGNRSDATAKVLHLARALSNFGRADVERIIEHLVDMLDQADGDADLEDDATDRCGAGDDGCGPFWLQGQLYWGTEECS